MRTLLLEEIGVDERCNPAAQRLILLEVACLEDLEPDVKIRIADKQGGILLGAVSQTVQEPTLVRVWVVGFETCVQALDKESGETIVDPRAIVLAKDEPGLNLGIPDDVLPISSGSGEEQRPL
jgi:hypothetical protein